MYDKIAIFEPILSKFLILKIVRHFKTHRKETKNEHVFRDKINNPNCVSTRNFE